MRLGMPLIPGVSILDGGRLQKVRWNGNTKNQKMILKRKDEVE